MAWHIVGEELRWLLNAEQLTAYLVEHGIGPASLTGIPVAAWHRKKPLYSAREALALAEANVGERHG